MLTLLPRALALVAASAVLGLTFNAVRPDGVALRAFAPPSTCAAPGGGGGSGAGGALPGWGGGLVTPVEVLVPWQAMRLCGDPGVLVADARPAQRFAEGHIAQAIHLPCAASGSEARTAVARMQDKHTVIVYGDTTAEARPVADDLRRRVSRPGLRLVVLDGGFPAWSSAGLACSSGPCPHCTEKQAQSRVSP